MLNGQTTAIDEQPGMGINSREERSTCKMLRNQSVNGNLQIVLPWGGDLTLAYYLLLP
jgi:hypothetical protein